MTQNIIFVLAFLAVVWRICTRKMTNVEWWLLAFVVMSIFLVQLQMFIGEDGKLSWILRYHQAALVFLYGWAAWGVVSLADRLSGKWRMGFVVVVGAWIVGTGGTSLWRIAKQAFVDSSRSARARAAEWAAEIIQKDLLGKFSNLDDLIARIGEVGYLPEGAVACKYIHQICVEKGLKLPICDGLYRILNKEIAPIDFMYELLGQPLLGLN